MGVVVLKFGGTSVATADKILSAARRAIQQKRAGNDVAVVVSARGKTTDELIALARELHADPPGRELDMLVATGEQQSIALLAMAIHALGYEATSLTGGQMGIVTDSVHGQARIQEISTTRIRQVFAEGKIAIVAGFQGIDQNHNITTLGRGGSDTTAVAIAAALDADVCEIYTDVDGVYSTDPRIVPEARRIDQISYDEMLELASVGAKVMHSRSIEFAKKFGVVIHVRNSGSDARGTIIRPEDPTMEHIVVRGAALAKSEARVTLRGVPDVPGVMHRIFSHFSAAHIVVDMIVQNIAEAGRTEVSFTLQEGDLPRGLRFAEAAVAEIGATAFDYSIDVAKVSVVGLGMRTHTGVADRMFRALAKRGINIMMITTSEIKISVLVDRGSAQEALAAVHAEFALHDPLPEYRPDLQFPTKERFGRQSTVDLDARLRSIARSLPAMEDILIADVDSDTRQGRVTLSGVPDRPGISYRIFSKIADANIPVDMIVQSVGGDGTTNLSFTVLKTDLKAAAAAARAAVAELPEYPSPAVGHVRDDADMTKISVRGVGMRSHPALTARLFETLANAGVNIQLINTSELHTTIVVAEREGTVAIESLQSAFGLTPNGTP